MNNKNIICKRIRRNFLSYKELQERIREQEWIEEFLLYCEKNNVEKSILYIVPKNKKICPCIRFKALYKNTFKRIECSECDKMPKEIKCNEITLSEFKVDKLNPLIQEFYAVYRSGDIKRRP